MRHHKIFASVRPGALPLPANRKIHSFVKPGVIDQWNEYGAGVRSLAMGDNVVTMFGMIGEDFWSDEGVTAKKVASQLRAIGDRPVEVHINSGGGDMFEGIAIYNVLREHPQSVTVKVMGVAASAASIIAMAGDDIQIGSGSFLMIHSCWVMAMGNQYDLRETADFLKPFDEAMANLYAERSGQDVKAVTDMMVAETWLSGSAAVEQGFANAILPGREVTTSEEAKASDKDINELRAMELSLVNSGMTRTQARARIQKLKNMPGAVIEPTATPGAGEDESWIADCMAYSKSIREKIKLGDFR